jgi:curved DNA-binding protein
MTMRLAEMGEPGSQGAPAGDLFITIALKSDDTYTLVGSQLHADLPMAPWELASGARVRIATPAGPVDLNVKAGTRPGTRLRLRGKGVHLRGDGGRGDLYATVRMALPDDMNEDRKRLLDQMREAGNGDVSGGIRARATA